MKIKTIKTYGKALGLKRPYSIAYKTVSDVKCLFVEIHLENGVIGIGSANPSLQVVGEDVDMAIDRLASDDFEWLAGKNISEFEYLKKTIFEKYCAFPGSMAAIDIALYDAFCKYLKMPLHAYLGRAKEKLPTSITIGIKNVEETLLEAKEYFERGFSVLKVKTGLDPDEDAERVIKIHESYPALNIRVDANQGYDVHALRTFVTLTESIPLELIEQPFPVNNFVDFMRHCPEKSAQLVIADESIVSPYDAVRLIGEVPNCNAYNIKLMKCGGISTGSLIADIARHHDKRLMWGCNDESIVSISAALSLSLSYQHTEYIDLDGSLDLAEDIGTGGFELKNGYMYPVDRPGLGVEVNH